MVRKPPAAFNRKFKPDATLSAVIGVDAITRAQATKNI